MRASSPFIVPTRFRLTAVVLIVALILLTNTACDFTLRSSVSRGTPQPFTYTIQLLAEEPVTEAIVHHSDLQNIHVQIKLQDNSLILKEDKTDYEGEVLLVIPNTYAQQEAKLIIHNESLALEKDIVLGNSQREWLVIYYTDAVPRFQTKSQSAQTQLTSVSPVSASGNSILPYRHTSDFPLHTQPSNRGTGGGISYEPMPTLIPTLMPTSTPTPTWQVLAEENFAPTRYGWVSKMEYHPNGMIVADARNGYLRKIASFGPNGANSRLKYPTPFHLGHHNMRLSLGFTFVKPDTDTVMVVLLHQTGSEETEDECYYAVSIDTAGQYALTKKQNNGVPTLLVPMFINPVTINQDVSNHLVITVLNDILSVEINNTPVASYNISPRLEAGQIWFGLEGQSNGVSTIDINNIVLSQLEN